MCAQLSDLLPVLTDKEKENSTTFRETLSGYLYHWPLFLIGLLFTTTLAFIYVQKTNPVFTIKASIIIKDEKKQPDEKQQLQDIDLSNSPKLAENEVNVLKSRNLIYKVVDDMQLWITYQYKDGLRMRTFYKNSPIVFRLLKSADTLTDVIFYVQIKNNHSFSLIGADNTPHDFNFDELLSNSFGTWKLDRVADLSKRKGEVIMIKLSNINKTAEEYQQDIDVELPDKLAPTIELSLKDQVAERGKDILDRLIQVYNENDLADKNLVTKKNLDFIDNRIASITDELNTLEQDVEGYRSRRGITDIESQSKYILQNQQQNDSKLNDVDVELNVINGVEAYLNSSQNIQSPAALLGQKYPTLSSLIDKLSALQLERNKLIATMPETNPMVDPVNKQIAATKAQIGANIQNIKSSLISSQKQLGSFRSQYQSSINNLPVQQRQLLDKTRKQSVKETLYTYLLQKREELSLNYASILPDAKVVDYGYAASGKISKTSLAYGASLAMGLLVPGMFIYGRKKLSSKITSRKEIENETGIALFGELSYARSPQLLLSLDNSITSEEFRDLRTSLHFLKGDKAKSSVTLVTSSIAGEGKSFVSSNLGHTLAISGKKTVILEMDLRKPRIGQIFGLEKGKGISDYLIGQSAIEAIIQPSNIHPKLDIITSGTFYKNPSELLENEAIQKQFFNWLRSNYDEVIVDTPPVNLVTDAKIISQYADTILYVIRQAFTYKSLLSFIRSLAKKEQFSNLKLVFNGIQKERYGYGYDYGRDYYRTVGMGEKIRRNLGLNDFFQRF